jgi:hypothetical protein
MLGVGLDGRGQPQRVVGRDTGSGGDRDNPELPTCERPRLVEDDGGHVARLFQPAAVTHEEPAARA